MNDRVEFEVLEEIKVAGILVIPKGGVAWGTVTEAQPKRRMARGGKLEIVMDTVRLVDGEKAALRATKQAKGGGHTGAMTAGIVVTGLLFWPAAPFFLFMHGKDISIPKGTEVPTFVNGNFHLDLSKFQQGTPTILNQAGPNQPQSEASSQIGAASDTQVTFNSTPSGAEVDLDGAFVGNTPSTVGVAPGEHSIRFTKRGFKAWERNIKVTTGKIEITAELESEEKQDAKPQ
ncbi:MAG: PEGA domain-containing protein [Candidatus Acidiferrales bacterium]